MSLDNSDALQTAYRNTQAARAETEERRRIAEAKVLAEQEKQASQIKAVKSVADIVKLSNAATPASTAVSTATPVASAANGGVVLSNGTVVDGVATNATNGGVVLADGTTAAGSEIVTGTPNFAFGAPSNAGYAAAALTAGKGAYNAFTNHSASAEQQARDAQTAAAMTVANVYTGGLASVADGISGGRGSKLIGKGFEYQNKFDDVMTLGVTKKIRDKMFHQDTRGVAQQHTGELAKDYQGEKDEAKKKAAMTYLQGMREQYQKGPPDPSKPFAGKYATWEEYLKGGLEARNLTGVYGNLKLGGAEYANYTQGQREAITQANIEANNYDSEKGEVIVVDEEKWKEIRDGVLSGKLKVTLPPDPNAPAPVTPMGGGGGGGYVVRQPVQSSYKAPPPPPPGQVGGNFGSLSEAYQNTKDQTSPEGVSNAYSNFANNFNLRRTDKEQ